MIKELNILNPFFEEPTKEFNVREIARTIKISPATASKRLKKLVKEEILIERKERIYKLYKSNLESYPYKDLKVYYNIKKLRESSLIEELNKFYLKPAIVLFGSSSVGLDTETSDIDLLIISEKTKEFPDIGKFEKKLKRKIQFFTVKNIKGLKNKHLINNAVNGITIQGEIKWT